MPTAEMPSFQWQYLHHLKVLHGALCAATRSAQTVSCAVESDLVEGDGLVRLNSQHPRHRADVGQQLLQIKGLGLIVVGLLSRPTTWSSVSAFTVSSSIGLLLHALEHLDAVRLLHTEVSSDFTSSLVNLVSIINPNLL